MHPVVIIPKICADESLHELPITAFVADMIARMDGRSDFAPTNFRIYKECGNLMVSVAGIPRCLEGHNYAYQVKLVMDAVTEARFFE